MIVGMPSIACCCDPPGPPPPGDCSVLNNTCLWNPTIRQVRLNISNFRKTQTVILGATPTYCLTVVTEWDYSVVLNRIGRCLFNTVGGNPIQYGDFPYLVATGPGSGGPCSDQPLDAFRLSHFYEPCQESDYPEFVGFNSPGSDCYKIGSHFACDFGLPEMTVEWTESVGSQLPCSTVTKSKTFPAGEKPRVTGTSTRTFTNLQTNEQTVDTVSVNCPLWAHMTCQTNASNDCESGTYLRIQLRWLHSEFGYAQANGAFEGDPLSYENAVAESRIVFPPLPVFYTSSYSNGTTFLPGFQGGANSGSDQVLDQMRFIVPEASFPNGARIELFRCTPSSPSSPCRFPWGTTGCVGNPCTQFPRDNGFQRPCGYPGFPFTDWTCYSEPQLEMEIIEPS